MADGEEEVFEVEENLDDDDLEVRLRGLIVCTCCFSL